MFAGSKLVRYTASNSCLLPVHPFVSVTVTQYGALLAHVVKVYASNEWLNTSPVPGNTLVTPHEPAGFARKIRPVCVPVVDVKPVPVGGVVASSTVVITVGGGAVFTVNANVFGRGPPTSPTLSV